MKNFGILPGSGQSFVIVNPDPASESVPEFWDVANEEYRAEGDTVFADCAIAATLVGSLYLAIAANPFTALDKSYTLLVYESGATDFDEGTPVVSDPPLATAAALATVSGYAAAASSAASTAVTQTTAQIIANAVNNESPTAAAETGSIKDRLVDIEAALVVIEAGTGGGGVGDGDVMVNHDFGGTDALRVRLDGAPVDAAVIRAYVAADYAAGTFDPEPPTTRTGSDGRWLAPLMLDADTYTITVHNPATKVTDIFTLEVA